MKNSKKLPKTKKRARGKRVKVNPPPPTIPGLFHFAPQFTGGYAAKMEPELDERYLQLRVNANPDVCDLAWILDVSQKISPSALDLLVLNNGTIMLAMTDEECETEFGERIDPAAREHQVFVMAQCCRVVLEMQRAIGSHLALLTDAKAASPERSQARKTLLNMFSKSLTLLHNGSLVHGRTTFVTQTRTDGSINKIPLTVAAIEVAQELATRFLKAPLKRQVISALEQKYKSDLVTSRDQKNEAKINWSDVYTQAGLENLPKKTSSKVKDPPYRQKIKFGNMHHW